MMTEPVVRKTSSLVAEILGVDGYIRPYHISMDERRDLLALVKGLEQEHEAALNEIESLNVALFEAQRRKAG